MKRIFISHSSKDKDYVEKMIDLLEACGVESKNIFCSSFEGYGIPLGENFLERIKDEIDNNALVLFILSNNFYNSAVSLCEMGATWIKSNTHIPILIPPSDYEDIKGVINLTQGIKINESVKLNSLYDRLNELGFIGAKQSFNIWERKRDNFLSDIKNLLESQPINNSNNIVLQDLEEKYRTLEYELQKYKEVEVNKDRELGKKNMLLKEKDRQILSLNKALKAIENDVDKKDALIELFENTDEKTSFDNIIDTSKDNLRELPRVVVNAMYYSYADKDFYLNPYEKPDEYSDAIEAAENDFLEVEGNWIALNESDPKVKRALKILDQLYEFIEGASEEFHSNFELKYDMCAKISSKKFWRVLELYK